MFKEWNKFPGLEKCLQGDVATLSCIPAVFANLLSALLAFAGLFALIMFIAGGFKFITSKGDLKKIEVGRNSFVYGIIGLSIVAFSIAAINIIAKITGVDCITGFGFGCK